MSDLPDRIGEWALALAVLSIAILVAAGSGAGVYLLICSVMK